MQTTTLHPEQPTTGERVARLSEGAVVAMDKAADYLRGQDLRGMLSDVERLAKRHPGATLLAAAAAGFLLARSLFRH